MKKTAILFLLCQSVFLAAQTKTAVTPYGEKITISPYANNGVTAGNGNTQLGGALIKPTTVQTSTTNTLAIAGMVNSTDTSDAPIVVADDGTVKKGAFPKIDIIPSDIGTVIAIDGKLEVAQEISAQMSADFSKSGSNGTAIYPIGNITNVIIDNKSRFTSSATGNSFTVEANGVYLVTINVQVSTVNITAVNNQGIVIGITDNSTGKWIARVNDSLFTNNNVQTLTLITSVPMVTGRTYSFAEASNYDMSIYALSFGSTGSGPVSSYSVKRLK